MIIIRAEEAPAVLQTFGYLDTNDAWSKMKITEGTGTKFIVPSKSLKQLAISEAIINNLASGLLKGSSTAAVAWLVDWPIYFGFELRLFWQNLDLELKSNETPSFLAAYWPVTNMADVDKIKAAYFMMMAFEFSGCILIKDPPGAVCVDDGEATILSYNRDIRNVLSKFDL